MILKEKLAPVAQMSRKLWSLARPYGLLKPCVVLAVIFLQGLLQVIGVTSIFPFLALAADPEGFRASQLGAKVLVWFPGLSNDQLLVWAGLFSIAMLVASNATNLVSDYVRAKYAQGLGHWLRTNALRNVASKPWSYFLGQNSAVLMKRTTFDVNMLISNIVLPLLEGTARGVTVVFLVTMLFLINPVVASGAAFVLAAYYIVVFLSLKKGRKKLSQLALVAERGVYKEAQQLLGGIKTIKIHQAEEFFIDRFSIHSSAQSKVYSKTPLHYQAPKYFLEPIAFGSIIAIVIAYVGLGQSINQILPLLGVVGIAGYRLMPAMQLLYAQIAQIGANLHVLNEVYDEVGQESDFRVSRQSSGNTSGAPPGIPWSGAIEFNDVSFRYREAANDVLRNITLSIPYRASVGIIGQTGSGKSTLVDLLMGLLAPTGGNISVDGIKLTRESMRVWQAGIGYVPQDIFLIDDTIRRNICLGFSAEEIDEERLRAATAAARILDFIEKDLPEGFETSVGERGVRLSGGQKQRIALARALYRRPRLLILDEATSALDTTTESEVVEAINSLQGEITMVVVAHRLSTIERCQFVVELSGGSSSVLKRP